MINLNIEHHFADSNVFLGVALKDDSYQVCKDYFKVKSVKITSNSVQSESQLVIIKLMTLSSAILKFILHHVIKNKIPDDNIYQNMSSIHREFISRHDDDNFPFGFNKEKFITLTRELFFKFGDLIKTGIFYETIDVLINSQINEVNSDYKKALNSLQILFKQVQVYYFNEIKQDNLIIESLNNQGIHNPDSRIILDAFKTSNLINETLLFVTRDQNIIDESGFISSLFNNSLVPKKLDDIVNNN